MSGPLPIICLVDDDLSVLKSLSRLLAAEGYAYLAFQDPAEFIKHAASHPVPLAVVDLLMPGLSGLQVQNCLRSLSPETHFIMLSGTEDHHVASQAMEAGATAVFHKLSDKDAFLTAVREALASAHC